MKIDEFKTVKFEQTGYPGNIGDSCAETSRLSHLRQLLGLSTNDLALSPFVSTTGFLRHPTAPEGWRENDFTSDQGLPLFVASRGTDPSIAELLQSRIKAAGYRTGNGDLVNPMFFGLLTDRMWLVNAATAVQAVLFKLPYRWNEAHKTIEKMEGSSADYLNWIHGAVYAKPWARKLVSKETLKAKIRNYYAVEPNSEELINLYDQVIERYW